MSLPVKRTLATFYKNTDVNAGFIAGNLHAVKFSKYLVFASYTTTIVIADTISRVLYVTNEYYSRTTTRHINAIKKAYRGYAIKDITDINL